MKNPARSCCTRGPAAEHRSLPQRRCGLAASNRAALAVRTCSDLRHFPRFWTATRFTYHLRCMDCDAKINVSELHQYGNFWKCRACHSSYRFCRDHVNGWASLGAEHKKAYILANRSEASKRGRKRELKAIQAVSRLHPLIWLGIIRIICGVLTVT